jgi:hypothetical protein
MEYTSAQNLMNGEPVMRECCPNCGSKNSLAKLLMMEQGVEDQKRLMGAFLTPTAQPIMITRGKLLPKIMIRCMDECLDCGITYVKKIIFQDPRYPVNGKSLGKN